MNLLIVRHAESMGNATGHYSAEAADSLSPHGEEQASSLVASLKAWNFDKIIVSSLQRALQTVAPYLAATNQRAEIWPEIAEACWHDDREELSDSWNSKPDVLPDSVPSVFDYRDDEAITPAHPESFGQGLRRVHEAMERIREMADQSDEFVLMVTHGHVIRELINLMLDTRDTVQFPHDNCGMTLMSFDGAWKMDFCNR
jgi:broad specificity phosphatase PhoE